jgi:hypothetical protein
MVLGATGVLVALTLTSMMAAFEIQGTRRDRPDSTETGVELVLVSLAEGLVTHPGQ